MGKKPAKNAELALQLGQRVLEILKIDDLGEASREYNEKQLTGVLNEAQKLREPYCYYTTDEISKNFASLFCAQLDDANCRPKLEAAVAAMKLLLRNHGAALAVLENVSVEPKTFRSFVGLLSAKERFKLDPNNNQYLENWIYLSFEAHQAAIQRVWNRKNISGKAKREIIHALKTKLKVDTILEVEAINPKMTESAIFSAATESGRLYPIRESDVNGLRAAVDKERELRFQKASRGLPAGFVSALREFKAHIDKIDQERNAQHEFKLNGAS